VPLSHGLLSRVVPPATVYGACLAPGAGATQAGARHNGASPAHRALSFVIWTIEGDHALSADVGPRFQLNFFLTIHTLVRHLINRLRPGRLGTRGRHTECSCCIYSLSSSSFGSNLRYLGSSDSRAKVSAISLPSELSNRRHLNRCSRRRSLFIVLPPT